MFSLHLRLQNSAASEILGGETQIRGTTFRVFLGILKCCFGWAGASPQSRRPVKIHLSGLEHEADHLPARDGGGTAELEHLHQRYGMLGVKYAGTSDADRNPVLPAKQSFLRETEQQKNKKHPRSLRDRYSYGHSPILGRLLVRQTGACKRPSYPGLATRVKRFGRSRSFGCVVQPRCFAGRDNDLPLIQIPTPQPRYDVDVCVALARGLV